MFWPPPLLESTRWYLALMGLSDQTSSHSTKPGRQLPLWMSPCHLRIDMRPSRLQDKRSKRNMLPMEEHCSQQGYDIFLDAFSIGAFGGWDPANENHKAPKTGTQLLLTNDKTDVLRCYPEEPLHLHRASFGSTQVVPDQNSASQLNNP